MRLYNWIIALTMPLSSACGGEKIVVNGVEIYESQWNKTLEELRPRVAFDLGCDAQQVEFLLFKRTGRYPSEVGVKGCGKRGTYVRAVGPGTGPWVLNVEGSNSTNTEALTPAPSPPSPAQTPASH